MIEEEQLIEYAQYVNHYYGTPKEYVLRQMAEGKDVILEIEIQGALAIKRQFSNALLLFVLPPSAQELKRRLVGRGTESLDVIEARLRRAFDEAEGMDSYDYILVNDDVDACVEDMHELIKAQHLRVCHNLDFIEQIREELKHV